MVQTHDRQLTVPAEDTAPCLPPGRTRELAPDACAMQTEKRGADCHTPQIHHATPSTLKGHFTFLSDALFPFSALSRSPLLPFR